jgi:hypothetical protein
MKGRTMQQEWSKQEITEQQLTANCSHLGSYSYNEHRENGIALPSPPDVLPCG